MIAETASPETEDLGHIHKILDRGGEMHDIVDAFVTAYFEFVSRSENAVLTAEITAKATRLDLLESTAGRVGFRAEVTKSQTLVHLRSIVRRLLGVK